MLRKFFPLIGLVIVLGVTACGSSTPTATWTPIASPAPVTVVVPTRTVGSLPSFASVDPAIRASVRLLLAVPDVPPVDVYLEGNLVGSRLAYGSLSSPVAAPPGKYLMRVVPSTISPDAADKLLLSTTVELGESESAIFVLGGSKDQFALKHVTENKSPVKGGQARVLIVSATLGDTKVDVSADEQPLVSLTSQDQQPDPQLMKTGRYNFKAAGGSAQPFNQSMTLLDYQVYTVIVFGPSAGALKLAIANSPTLRETRVRILQVSTDLGKVDAYLNGKPLSLGLDYRAISDWQTLTMGASASFNLRILPAGTDPKGPGTPLSETSLSLKPDQASDIVLFDPRATLKVRVFAEDLSPTEPDRARLTYLNLIPKVGNVLPFISGSQISGTQPVAYGSLSRSISVLAGTRLLTFGVTTPIPISTPGTQLPPQVKMVEAPPDMITLKAGSAYFYVVTGQAEQYGPLYFGTDVGTSETAGTTTNTGDTMPVRVINAIADLKAIDIYVNGEIIFKNVESGKGTPPVLINATAQSITLTAAGDSKILGRIDFRFHKDEKDTLIAVGTANTANMIQAPDMISDGAATVRVVNGAPEQSQVSVQAALASSGSSTATPSLKNAISVGKTLLFAAATGFTPIASGTYAFIVFGNDGKIVGQLDNVVLQTSKRYDLILLPGSDKGTVSISVVVTG